MTRRRLLQLLASAVATVVLGYFVVSSLSIGDFEALARDFDFRSLLLAFALYVGANVVRAFRFRLLVGGGVSARAFLRIIFVQNFMNTFLPLRAGEVSYVYMVHRTGNVTAGRSVGSLLAARALDFLAAVLVPLVISPFSRAFATSGLVLLWLGAFVLVGSALLALAVTRAEPIADYLSKRLSSRRAWLVRAGTLLGDTLRSLGQLRERNVLSRVVLLSLSCWLLIYASGYALLAGTGLELSLADAVFAYGFPVIASMTPLYMLGGFGVYEGSVGAGLAMVGVAVGAALASGVLLHVAELSFVVVLLFAAPLLGRQSAPAESA
ncbi:MAG TPA: lysylphosphatidylglycerol synthase transmembrane domain-containing protein [Polyangiaceae bacterium]